MLSVNVLCLGEFIQGQNQLTVSLVCKARLSTGSFISSAKNNSRDKQNMDGGNLQNWSGKLDVVLFMYDRNKVGEYLHWKIVIVHIEANAKKKYRDKWDCQKQQR